MNLRYEILQEPDSLYKLIRHRGDWHIDVVCIGTYELCKRTMEFLKDV